MMKSLMRLKVSVAALPRCFQSGSLKVLKSAWGGPALFK
jgi:hypothetical protein